jgi:hypothetical protein
MYSNQLKALGPSGSTDNKYPSLNSCLLCCGLFCFDMRLIALVAVALAMSASALPRISSERGLGGRKKTRADNGTDSDSQTSLSESHELSPN